MGAGMVSLGVSAGVISVGAGAGMGSGALAGSGYPGGPLDHALVPGMVRWVPGSPSVPELLARLLESELGVRVTVCTNFLHSADLFHGLLDGDRLGQVKLRV